METCVIIPAYNEGENIGGLVERLLTWVKEVVVVDDGSTDMTAQKAELAGATVLVHLKNLGKGAALRKGFEYAIQAGYDALITMDGDGQHDWREIPYFLKETELSNSDIVVGTRMGSVKGMPLIRLLTNLVTSMIVSLLCGHKLTDSQSGYRLIRREVLQKVKLVTANYDTESELLIKAARKGFRITEIPIKTIYGRNSSKINRFTDTLRFIRLVVRSSIPGCE